MSLFIKTAMGLILVSSVSLSALETRAETVTEREAIDGDDFNAVEIHGRHKLLLSQGSDVGLSYTTDDDWADQIYIKIRGNTLHLGMERKRFWGSDPREATFELQVEHLNEIVSHGTSVIEMGDFESDEELIIAGHGSSVIRAGNIDVEDLDIQSHGATKISIAEIHCDDIWAQVHGAGNLALGDVVATELSVKMHGAGNISIYGEGEIEELDIESHGAGNFDAANAVVQEADLVLMGAAKANVNVEEKLDIAIHGAGLVTYRGDPEIDKVIRGFGAIRADNR